MEFINTWVGIGHLMELIVKNNLGQIVKRIQFNQESGCVEGEDEGIDGSSSSNGLRLNSVMVVDSESTQYSEIYRFEYNGYKHRPTRGVDHWGYYNGANNKSFFPRIYTTYKGWNGDTRTLVIPGGYRGSSSLNMQKGVLSKIIYPTGGYTKFHYEANRYVENKYSSFNFNSDTIANCGGLRIRMIEDVDEKGGATYRRFLYSTKLDRIDSAGELTKRPNNWGMVDLNRLYETTVNCVQISSNDGVSEFTERSWINSPRINLIDDLGAPVVYPYVTEVKTMSPYDTDEMVIGKNTYRYNVASDDNFIIFYEPLVYYSKRTADIDTYLEETVMYKHINWGLVQVDSTRYSHNTSVYNSSDFTDYTWFKRFRVYRNYEVQYEEPAYNQYDNIQLVNLPIYLGYDEITGKNSYVKTDIGSLNNTEYWNYDYEHNLISKTNVDGSQYRYVYCSGMIPSDTTGIYQLMYNKRIRGIPIESYKLKGGDTIVTLRNNYKICNEDAPASVFFAPHKTFRRIGSGGEDFVELHYDAYDNVIDAKGSDDTHTSYIWGYGNTCIVAVVEGCDYWSLMQMITASDLPLLKAGDPDALNRLRLLFSGQRGVYVTTYTHKPLVGILSKTAPDGRTTFYRYDDFGRLKDSYYIENGVEHKTDEYEYQYVPY